MATKNTVLSNSDNDIMDVDLSIIKKKRFRINGDNTKILELNVSDMGIVSRLDEAYPKLMALQDKVSAIADINEEADDMELLSTTASKLKEIDTEMREILDFIFQSNVSEVCGSEGSMYDPIEGTFRYEHIISTLVKLYENNLNAEFNKMKENISKHTAKYTKARKKR
jgi:hypothetical protein